MMGTYQIVASKLLDIEAFTSNQQIIGADSEGVYYVSKSQFGIHLGLWRFIYSDGSGSQLVFDGLVDGSYENNYFMTMQASDVDGDGHTENLLTVLSTPSSIDATNGHSREVAIQQFVIGTDEDGNFGVRQS